MNLTDFFKIKYLIEKHAQQTWGEDIYVKLINWINSEIIKYSGTK